MGSGNVESLDEFNGSDGTRKLVAFADNRIFDATAAGVSATDITAGSAITGNRWQTVNFRDRLICVNGLDVARQYDGTTVSDAVYTGPTTPSDLVHVTSFKNRLYFAERNSARIWYGAVDAITGALTSFDVQSILTRGGNIEFITNWSRESGSGFGDLLVIVSNLGEVVVYSGASPADSAWTLVGRIDLPVPLGRRAFVPRGNDVIIITERGGIPLSKALALGENVGNYDTITDIIQNAFNDAARAQPDAFGWEGLIYPRGRYGLINVPISESLTSHQYIVNLDTGAWCRFKGQDAYCWSLHKERLFFGS
jgi:hypothetical protein